MNENCKYCKTAKTCLENAEYNSIYCQIHKRIPKVIDKTYDELQQENQQLKEQQKEFTNYLESMLSSEKDNFSVARVKDVLEKYKEIVGDKQ